MMDSKDNLTRMAFKVVILSSFSGDHCNVSIFRKARMIRMQMVILFGLACVR